MGVLEHCLITGVTLRGLWEGLLRGSSLTNSASHFEDGPLKGADSIRAYFFGVLEEVRSTRCSTDHREGLYSMVFFAISALPRQGGR